jgi:hypothetical protein
MRVCWGIYNLPWVPPRVETPAVVPFLQPEFRAREQRSFDADLMIS